MPQVSQELNQKQLAERRFGPLPVVKFTDVQAAWLAALIDGEGSVGIWRQKRAESVGQPYKYNGIIAISNTNFDLIARIKEVVKLCYACTDRSPKKRGYKTLYTLRVSNRAVPSVLRQVLPHLIVKKRQAELVLRYYEAVHTSPVRSAEDHTLYEYFWREAKKLNKRGNHGLE